MSYVTIAWSSAAAAALLLCVVHFALWVIDRRATASLALAVLAGSLTGISICELGMMVSGSAADWLFWVRWCHLPLFVHITAIAVFVRLYLGTGRLWLMWTIIAMRAVILVANFRAEASFNFASVDAIRYVDFLGERVAVLSGSQVSNWQWLATLSCIALILYVLDAVVTRWRASDAEARRPVLVVGGSIVLFLVLSVASTQLVIWGFVSMPMLVTPPFLGSLVAMACELSRDMLRAGRLASTLRESESWLGLAAEASQLGFWTWDARRDVIWATERSRALFGFDPSQPLCLDLLRARIHKDDVPAIEAAFRAALDHQGVYSVQFRCGADQAQRWISSQGEVQLDDRARPCLVRGVLRDVTDQKQAEHEAAELRRALTHAGRVTILGQLSSALAHELSQPLGAILRNAETASILLAAPTPDIQELRAIVSDIERDDRRAGDVIDRLRALLKRRELQMQPTSVDALVKDAGLLVRADASARHVSLELITDESLPLVAGDRVHLLQVLINLIVNAVDATCGESGARRRVTVTAHSPGRTCVEICVADSGTGISTETLPRIFEPFFTTKAGGMGMGLAVSRTIIEAHGGKLWAENATTGGAIFRVALPTIEAEAV